MRITNCQNYPSTNFKGIYPNLPKEGIFLHYVRDCVGSNSHFAKELKSNYDLIKNSDAVDMFFQKGRGFFTQDAFLILKRVIMTDANQFLEAGTKIRPAEVMSQYADISGTELLLDVDTDGNEERCYTGHTTIVLDMKSEEKAKECLNKIREPFLKDRYKFRDFQHLPLLATFITQCNDTMRTYNRKPVKKLQ